MNKNLAFSLIELMVVIAIVAILAAVAIPAYKNYTVTARFAAVVPIIENLMSRSIEFSSTKGYFGNAYDLGLSATPGSGSVDDPTALSPYFSNGTFNIGDQSYPPPVPCGKNGTVNGHLDPAALGLDPAVVGYFTFECDYWNFNNVVQKQCFYVYGPVQFVSSDPSNIISGWINGNTTTASDGNNFTTYETSLTSWINSTCQ
jgi:prepilin-type N-terminal cleavage/methylation domain-containing protein